MDSTAVLDDLGLDYGIASGYVATLTGCARSTEDVDVGLAPVPESELERLATRFDTDGYSERLDVEESDAEL
ncbi:MAG: hypothetical protein V5A43_09905 [Haloarculaceae archaeon]